MLVNEYFDAVYVINLDRRTDRMEKLDPQLNKLGIKYERFPAVDGNALNISPIIAGTMSHQYLLSRCENKRVLVLEDDAQFVDDFNEKFDEYMQHLPEDYDIFYLGALIPKYTGKVDDIGNPYWFKQVLTTGSHAYSVHPERTKYFAHKLDGYEWYIDIGLRIFAEGYKALIAQPNLVTQFPSYSDLRLEEVNDF